MTQEILDKLSKIESQNEDILAQTKNLSAQIQNYTFVSQLVLSKLNGIFPAQKQEEFIQVEQKEEENNPSGGKRKIPVIQRVMKEGKSVHLAKVFISQNGQHIKETKTNGQGKWTANLGIGKYDGKITRPATPDLKEIDFTFKFEVTSLDKPIELPILDLNK